MPNESLHPSASSHSNKTNLRSAYNPITLQDVQRAPESPLFAGLETTSSRTLAGFLFAVIFVLGRGYMQFSGFLLLILLACVLYRMEPRERQIAAIPLAFSAIRIALGFTMEFPMGLQHSPGIPGSANPDFEAGLYWMPLLFSAYLFYSPWRSSHTSRVVFWYSMALLLSGLIPGDGYLYVSAMLFYTLFIALAISLISDFSPEKFARRSQPLAPLAPPQPASPAQPAFS
jgi:hypothetical protein